MTVETNGTVDAEDAIAYSARIFQDQLSMFVNFDDPQEVIKEVKSTEPEFNRNLLKRVEELELSVRSLKATSILIFLAQTENISTIFFFLLMFNTS